MSARGTALTPEALEMMDTIARSGSFEYRQFKKNRANVDTHLLDAPQSCAAIVDTHFLVRRGPGDAAN